MSIQEILNKDPNRWKYKECTEIIDGDTTQEQKQTASDRQASIKAWLKSKEETSSKPVETTQNQINKTEYVDVPKELPTATEEDLKYSETLISFADKIERLAVYRLTKKGIPLRGDIVNAERNFLLEVVKFQTGKN